MRLEFVLNSEPIFINIEPSLLLSNLLRSLLKIKSIHQSCNNGFCGQCMVLINNVATPTCIVPAYRVHGTVVQTIEGLSTDPNFPHIEKGFLSANLNPCPYCAGTKSVIAEGLIRTNIELNAEKIYSHLPQIWCPCSSVDDFVIGVLEAHRLRFKKELWNGR